MSLSAGERAKALLVRAGRSAPTRVLEWFATALDSLQTARWLENNGLFPPVLFETREEVFELMAQRVERAKQPLYLEFGVYRGASLRWWANRLTSPSARFVGFDSFEGLPAGWNWQMGKGAFDTGGAVPDLDDDRVSFIPGWFDETLPDYSVPAHDRLVVNVDADIYTSASVVLQHIGKHLAPGDLIYFDEFRDFDDERRAFADFLSLHGGAFESVGADSRLRALAVAKC